MSTRTSASRPDSCSYPSKQDLGRLASTIHSVAQGRGLSEKVARRYEAWIFVFLGWCLRAPPYYVGRDRVGGFWTALTQRQVPKWKVCVAMDALGFFFGAVGGPDGLPGSPPFEAAGRTSGPGTASDQAALQKPNPTIEASPDKEPIEPGGSEKLSRYLPEGTLPTGTDPGRYVPTSNPKENQEKDLPASEPRGKGGPKTLFNPEGTARPQRTRPSEEETGQNQDPPHQASPQSETTGQSSEKIGRPSQPTVRSEPKMVPIEIPETIAERVKEGARKLGLPPGLFAARALDLACNEVGVERVDPADSEGPTERYQTQTSSSQSTDQGHSDASRPPEDPTGSPDPSGSDRPTGPEKGNENSSRVGSSPEGEGLPKDVRSVGGDGWFGVA